MNEFDPTEFITSATRELLLGKLADDHHVLFISDGYRVASSERRLVDGDLDEHKLVQVDMRELQSPDDVMKAIHSTARLEGLVGGFTKRPKWPAGRDAVAGMLMRSPTLLKLDHIDEFIKRNHPDTGMLLSWLRWMRQNQSKPANLRQLMTATENFAAFLPVGASHTVNDMYVLSSMKEVA